MAKFEQESERLSYELWQETLTPKLFTYLRLRQDRPIKVKLQHRLKELYVVVGASPDEPETRVKETDTLLGEGIVRIYPECSKSHNHLYSGMIMAKLAEIRVKKAASKEWDSLLDHVTAHVFEAAGNGYDEEGDRVVGISVEFLTTRVYRCFEQVADNW